MADIKLVPDFVDEGLTPITERVGDTLGNLWDLSFGNRISMKNERQKIGYEKDIEDYRKSIYEKTSAIPQERVTDPKLHIVGPAMEASKYYVESEDLREMFANLIASSIDKDMISECHPSFVEIIKQLSPFDAQVISSFKEADQEKFPIVEIRLWHHKENKYMVFRTHVMNASIKNDETQKMYASSITNLERLGLIDIDYSGSLSDENLYDYVVDHPSYLNEKKRLEEINSEYILDYTKGTCDLTPLCTDFMNTCF